MNNIILIGNAALYIGTFLIYQYKVKKITLGSIILLLYSVLAVSAISLYNTKSYHNQDITVIPFVYLYISLMIIFKPLLKVNNTNIATITVKHNKFIMFLSVLTIFVCFFVFIPRLTLLDFSDLVNPDAMSDAYFENRLEVSKRMGFGIMNLLGFLTNLLGGMSMLLLGYNVLFIKKKVLTIGLFAVVIIRLIVDASMGHRGLFLTVLFDMIFVYFCFKHYFSKKTKKILIGSFCSLTFLMSIVFLTITQGRAEAANTDSENFMLDYMGQVFLNFNEYGLNVGGTREGDRTFPLIKVLLGMPTASNFMERRDIYRSLRVNDSIFTTVVGDFTIDYGPFFALIILGTISLLYTKVIKSKSWNFGHLLLIMSLFNICTTYGLFKYAEIGGNLFLLFFVAIYLFFNAKQSH